MFSKQFWKKIYSRVHSDQVGAISLWEKLVNDFVVIGLTYSNMIASFYNLIVWKHRKKGGIL